MSLHFKDFLFDRPKWGWWIAIIIPSLVISYFLIDREPPLIMTGEYSVSEGHPGDEITFEVPIDRTLGRQCSVNITRFIQDSSGAIQVLNDRMHVTSSGIAKRDEKSQDLLRLKIVLPVSLPSGESHLLTESSYQCARNPTTWVWPIDVSFDWTFMVLPPRKADSIVIITPLTPEVPQVSPVKPLN